jgi:DNA helicase II / ATP-dependent DNA helicase PcrA
VFEAGATTSYLDPLNPEQLAAATHPTGPLLVLAGAGTGKTTTLAARVAWLIDQGATPERVLLVTFTRRAAREMLGRARSYLGRSPKGRHAGKVVGGTFHSVAHRFVRRHASVLGLPAGFGVLDAGDAADLLDIVRQEAGVGQTGRRFPRKSTLLDIYSRTVNAQRPLRELLAEAFPWCERHADDLARLFVDYGARKRGLGVIDLDDLLLYWRALAQDAVVGAQLSAGIDHLLVDEYQDVNGLQVDLVRGLRSERPDVTVVGDDLQAVYGFRSASPEHILAFPEHFPGAAVVTLERNYRATQPLLDVANAVAAQAERAYRKALRTERPGGRAPELVLCLDEAAQATEVCERVLDARERGAALREQAVLMRASHDSGLLELELARRDIPYVKYGGLRYLEAAHVKDFLALLRLADNPADRLAWFRWLQLLDGVGPATAGRVLEALEPDAGGLGDVLARWPAAQGALPAEAREPADAVVAALGAAVDEPARGRAPRGCATRWARSSRRTTPTAPFACSTSTRWWRPPASRPTWPASSPTLCSTRRPRARTWPGPGASTRTGSRSAPSIPPRASNGARSTCSRSTTATSPPTWRRAIARRSRRSAACSTSRSPGPSATCTSTCRCATTTARAGSTTAMGTARRRAFSPTRCSRCAVAPTAPASTSTPPARSRRHARGRGSRSRSTRCSAEDGAYAVVNSRDLGSPACPVEGHRSRPTPVDGCLPSSSSSSSRPR